VQRTDVLHAPNDELDCLIGLDAIRGRFVGVDGKGQRRTSQASSPSSARPRGW